LSGYDLQPFCFGDCFFAAMRFEIAHDHVHTAGLQLLGFFEHLIGLADACGVTHEDLQLAPLRVRHNLFWITLASYCGKTRTSIPCPSHISSSSGPRRNRASPLRWVWPTKSCVMPRDRAKSNRARPGSSPSRISMRAPAALASASR